jgi:hypothetical protein
MTKTVKSKKINLESKAKYIALVVDSYTEQLHVGSTDAKSTEEAYEEYEGNHDKGLLILDVETAKKLIFELAKMIDEPPVALKKIGEVR